MSTKATGKKPSKPAKPKAVGGRGKERQRRSADE